MSFTLIKSKHIHTVQSKCLKIIFLAFNNLLSERQIKKNKKETKDFSIKIEKNIYLLFRKLKKFLI